MDDRTMLELAAKAVEYRLRIKGAFFIEVPDYVHLGNIRLKPWNPLADDGDALRLAVALGISVTPYPIYNEDTRHSVLAKQRRRSDTLRETNPTEVIELYGDDPFAATRRAITRAAAAIQLAKEDGK